MTYYDTRSQNASNLGSSAGRAGSTAGQASTDGQSESARQQAQRTAERVTEDARHQASATVAHQKGAAADQISGLAGALHRTAEQLREQQQDRLAGYTDSFADDVDRVASGLRDRDTDALVRQARDFARRRPDVFLGGAVATGFLLARFLKSSGDRPSADRPRQSSSPAGSFPAAAAAGDTGGAPGYAAGPTSTRDTV